MEFLRVNPSSPEQVFIVVRNAHGSSTMTPGHGVFWNHQFDPGSTVLVFTTTTDNTGVSTSTTVGVCSTTVFDGYGVTFCGDQTNPAPHIGAFAGVIAGRAIAPGDFGSIQVYGMIDSVYVGGYTNANAPWVSLSHAVATATGATGTTTVSTSTWTVTYLSSYHRYILRPYGIYNTGTNEGGASTQGYFGFIDLGTAPGVGTTTQMQAHQMGPYLVPIGLPTTTGGSGSVPKLLSNSTDTGVVKAFIRAL